MDRVGQLILAYREWCWVESVLVFRKQWKWCPMTQRNLCQDLTAETILLNRISVLWVLVLSCRLNLFFSSFVQVSLHAAVLLVSQGLSVRRGFVTTIAWMGEHVTSLRGTSQCVAVWQNILGIVVSTVSPTKYRKNDCYHALCLNLTDIRCKSGRKNNHNKALI